MSTVAIEELYAKLTEQLEQAVRDRIEMKVVGESGLSVKVDGENCLTSIGCVDKRLLRRRLPVRLVGERRVQALRVSEHRSCSHFRTARDQLGRGACIVVSLVVPKAMLIKSSAAMPSALSAS
jgi:hypothetical protein